jgi:hypothetical protein
MNVKTIDIKGKSYTPVAERVRLVHETRESFEIVESTPIQAGECWLWRAVIRVNDRQYVGTAMVKLNARPGSADATDPWACAETSAIGRALGFANMGVVEGIASADEVISAEQSNEVPGSDNVQPMKPKPQPRKAPPTKQPAPQAGKLLPSQHNALKTLYLRLNQEIPPDLGEWSFEQAAATIQGLQGQLKQAS